MKRFELRALLLVVVVCALVCRFTAKPTLEMDLKQSLDYFWGNPQTRVHIAEGKAEIDVTVPEGMRRVRRDWTEALVKFIALRHPERPLRSWSVTFGGRVAPDYPAHEKVADDWEAATSEIRRRAVQTELDNAFGGGRVLVLVDVVSRGVSHWLPNVRPAEHNHEVYGLLDYDGAERRRERHPRGEEQLDVCLVFNAKPWNRDLVRASTLVQSELSLSGERGDKLSYLTLP